jgi:hypothetical protein
MTRAAPIVTAARGCVRQSTDTLRALAVSMQRAAGIDPARVDLTGSEDAPFLGVADSPDGDGSTVVVYLPVRGPWTRLRCRNRDHGMREFRRVMRDSRTLQRHPGAVLVAFGQRIDPGAPPEPRR